MTEAKFRSKVVEMLASVLAFPVENYVADGVADVCCLLGWLELKIADPPLKGGAIPIHIRPAQKLWLRTWTARGGRAWVLTHFDDNGVHDIWFLHDPIWACDNYGHVDLDTLAKSSVGWWVRTPTGADLISKMRGVTCG